MGLNTITDFLQKKGIKTDGSPNTLVEPDVYAVLEKEFGGSRITGNERESIRERISQKQATITLTKKYCFSLLRCIGKEHTETFKTFLILSRCRFIQ